MGQVLGALFAILLGLLSVPQFLSYQTRSQENTISAGISEQTIQFNQASSDYIQQNQQTILSAATSSQPFVASVGTLQAAGYLPASFKATNVYGQTYELQILQPSSGSLQGLAITTGGTALSDRLATKIASLIGQQGGFVPKNDSGIYSAGYAYGPVGWGPLSTNGYSVTAGHIASLINFTVSQLSDNRLYRVSVPGQPQLNTMTTPLVMGSIQVEGTTCSTNGSISVDTYGAVLSCISLKWSRQSGGSWKDPVASYATLPSSGNNKGDVRLTLDTNRAFAWNGTMWVALAIDKDGNIAVPGLLTTASLNLQKTATAGTACTATTDGNLAMDATGAPLSCQSGVWAKGGGTSPATATARTVTTSSSCASYTYSCPGGYAMVAPYGPPYYRAGYNCYFWGEMFSATPTCATYGDAVATCGATEALTGCTGSASGKTCTGVNAVATCLSSY